jgi:DNA repair ATPase RecN
MGKNKKLRKDIHGEIRVINAHLEKIAEELEKPQPNYESIAKWGKDIDVHQRRLAKLTAKLPGRRRQ